MEQKVREAHTAHSSTICVPDGSGEGTISVGTKNNPCGGTWRRKKANASVTILAEITQSANC